MESGAKPPKQSFATVGYCNPPLHTRFKKGQSGNPKGRPKGTLNITTVLERTLREKVAITVKGRRKTVTKLEAALQQVVDKAASGELKAFQVMSRLVHSAEEREVQAPVPNDGLDEVDQEVVLGIMKRFENSRKEDPVQDGQANETDTKAQ